MTGARSVLAIAILLVAALPVPARAQAPGFELALGGVFNGATPAGTVDASLLDPSGGQVRLFRSTNRIAPGWGAEVLLSTGLSERLRLELGVGWFATQFESEISGDLEDATPVTATMKADHFSAELALAYRMVHRDRFDIFVRGGGGGFREVTGDRALVDNGWRASVGGGTQIRLRQAGSGLFDRLALRADLRMVLRGGGVPFGDTRRRVSPSVFAGLVFGQ